MYTDESAGTFFNSFAGTFDTLYDGKRNALMRYVDQRWRSDMFRRYELTFEALGDLTGKSVADIGCGSGPYVVEALARGARQVTALDPAPNMLDLLRQRLEATGRTANCRILQGYFPGTELEPCDHAIVMGVMDYVADPPPFLSALRKVVRRSAVISFSSRHWFRTPFRKVRYSIRRCPVYFYGEQQIADLCHAAGFHSVRIVKIPGAGMDYHVCARP